MSIDPSGRTHAYSPDRGARRAPRRLLPDQLNALRQAAIRAGTSTRLSRQGGAGTRPRPPGCPADAAAESAMRCLRDAAAIRCWSRAAGTRAHRARPESPAGPRRPDPAPQRPLPGRPPARRQPRPAPSAPKAAQALWRQRRGSTQGRGRASRPRVNPFRPCDPLPAGTAARGSVAAFQARAGHPPTAWTGCYNNMTTPRMRPVAWRIRRAGRSRRLRP
jgi:hypothetical protein